MTQTLLLLAIALLVAFAAPLVASVIPGRSVPETVILVFAGAVIGRYLPYASNEGMGLLSELGMAFLFLMAGFEIVPSEMNPAMTKHAVLSWCASLGIAFVFTLVVPLKRFVGLGAYAFAILLTTTAYGTLAPIMRERGLTGTKVGEVVTVYGAMGEVLPIIAMAFLLSTRAPLRTTVVLVLYVGVCIAIASFPRRAKTMGSRLQAFLHTAGAATSESSVRAVSLLLVFLVFLAGAMGFDAALGAFAAGFTLRALLPEGDESLEARLRGISSGFFVPVFFFVSGASIDLSAVSAAPGLLVGFILLLVLVRGVVVAASLRLAPETRDMSWQETFSAATYCTMALPLVVAITNEAIARGAMRPSDASVLVTAGAITVLVVPIITSLVRRTSAVHPVAAAHELAAHESLHEVLQRQREDFQAEQERLHELRHDVHNRLSSADYLALASMRADRRRAERVEGDAPAWEHAETSGESSEGAPSNGGGLMSDGGQTPPAK